jgi:hypothetical protein
MEVRATAGVESVLRRFDSEILHAEIPSPLAALGGRLLEHVELFAKTLHDRLDLRQLVALSHEREAQLSHREQRLHVIAADLAADVAQAAHVAPKHRVLDLVGDPGAAVHQR